MAAIVAGTVVDEGLQLSSFGSILPPVSFSLPVPLPPQWVLLLDGGYLLSLIFIASLILTV